MRECWHNQNYFNFSGLFLNKSEKNLHRVNSVLIQVLLTAGSCILPRNWHLLWGWPTAFEAKLTCATLSSLTWDGYFWMGLENLQGCNLHRLTKQLAPLPHCPHGQKVYLHNYFAPFCFQLMPVASCPPTVPCCEKKTGSILATWLQLS